MPRDAPRTKHDNTRALGASIVEYDRDRESREEIAVRIAHEREAVVVPAFDDADIVAGQGTVGIEIAEQCAAVGVTPDDVVVACSGGGLVAGIALALEAHLPGARVWAAEPAGFDDHRRSLAAGRRLRNERLSGSICDALMAPTPGEITFEINRRLLAGGLVATDDEVRGAVAWAARTLKLIVEPGGAVGLACVRNAQLPTQGRTVVVVLTGGNIDAVLLQSILAFAPGAEA
jgi:threonine dehydratase